MKKYVLLFMSLLLVSGCNKNSEDDLVKEYQKDYIAAIAVFKGLMNYEYNMTIKQDDVETNSNVKYNKQGEFAIIKDNSIGEVINEDGTTTLPKRAISYFDTQTSKYVTYDDECGRGWVYDPITLSSDNKYGPYTQFLALANAEKITKFENNVYTLEFDAKDVSDAISNNQFEYSGKITMDVVIDKDLFKDVTIHFSNKEVKLNFINYANVSAYMEPAAQDAKHYTSSCNIGLEEE